MTSKKEERNEERGDENQARGNIWVCKEDVSLLGRERKRESKSEDGMRQRDNAKPQD